MSETNTNTLLELMNAYTPDAYPSLKAFALVFNLAPDRLYGVAKTPKEGEVYNAKVYNWDAIERFITRRLDPEKGWDDLETVVQKAMEIDADLKENDGRRVRGALPDSKLPRINVEGKIMPVRKFKSFEENFEPETGSHAHPSGIHTILLKGDPHVYAIVHQTAGYTCLRPINISGEYSSDFLKVISNSALNGVGFGPSNLTFENIKKKYAEFAALQSE